MMHPLFRYRTIGFSFFIEYDLFFPVSMLSGTLSKILCKWKQDSVVSLFLYLNSVFKHKHKLIHNQAPV